MTKVAVTGHTKGLGKAIYQHFDDSVGMSRANGFDIRDDRYHHKFVEQIKDCDVFVNCAQDHFGQTEILFYVAHHWQGKIINIGSQARNSVLSGYGELCNPYSVEKKALELANARLFLNGVDSTIINFGDLENLEEQRDGERLPFSYCIEVIEWVLKQPHRVQQLDIEPKQR